MKLLRHMQLNVAEAHQLYNDFVEPFVRVTEGWLHTVQILLGSPYPTLQRKVCKTSRNSIHKATSSDETKRFKSILRTGIFFRHDALYRTSRTLIGPKKTGLIGSTEQGNIVDLVPMTRPPCIYVELWNSCALIYEERRLLYMNQVAKS